MREDGGYYVVYEDFDTRVLPCLCREECEHFKSEDEARKEAIRYLKDLIAACRARLSALRAGEP